MLGTLQTQETLLPATNVPSPPLQKDCALHHGILSSTPSEGAHEALPIPYSGYLSFDASHHVSLQKDHVSRYETYISFLV